MKFFVFIALFMVQSIGFANDRLGLKCLVKVHDKVVEVSYSASKSKMDLTRTSDGALFGSSFEGNLVVIHNGTEILNRPVDAAAEEYGVIIQDDKLVYVNLNIEDESGEFSKDGIFFMTFGQSFDEESTSFTTDSMLKSIGGGRKFPKTYSAKCSSF